MSVILLTPSHNGGRTIRKCLHQVKRLESSPAGHIFVTNNCTDHTNLYIDNYLSKHWGPGLDFLSFNRISWDFPSDFMERMKDPYAAIAIARQRLLMEARRLMEAENRFTHAMFLDDDIELILPTTLKRLTDWGVDVVSGSYLRLFHQSHPPALSAFWLGSDGSMLRKEPPLKPLETPALVSAGCLCLRRDVVLDERLHFFPIYKPPGISDVSEDFGFCRSLVKYGYRIHLDTIVPIKHIIRDDEIDKPWFKDADGNYVPFKFPPGR